MVQTEIWLSPLILLPGVALLIISTAARFAQITDEFHRLIDHPDKHGRILSRHLLERASHFKSALVSLYVSVVLLSTGSLLGGVLTAWTDKALWITGVLTIFGIVCLVYAAAHLVLESRLCLKIIDEHRIKIEEGA